MINRRTLLAGATASSALVVVGCTASSPQPPGPAPTGTESPRVDPARHQVVARTPSADLVAPRGAPGALVVSRALLGAATAVVVVAATAPSPTPSAASSATPTASGSSARPTPSASPVSASAEPSPATPDPAAVARALRLPLFVDSPDLIAELDRLQTRTVIAYGSPAHVGNREVIPEPATAADVKVQGLPVPASQAAGVVALSYGDLAPSVAATLAAVGVEPLAIPGPHPGVTGASTAKVKAHTGPVLALGDGFGTDQQFAGQVAVTRTAKELPGGGVAPFPGRTMIALYGHPQTPALGMMGEQPPAQAVTRLGKLVEEYRLVLGERPVMGSFEIITTVASSSATSDGDYSYETPIDLIMPWVEAAEAADIYVVLDLQPGRTDFLTQAKRYAPLLERPWVGLALDPEWRLPPDGKHLVQVGQVKVDEVNQVGAWLADFVAERKLPPKVLTLHQFQTRMIIDRARLDTSRPEVQYLVHVDGQGGQGAKQGTWSVMKKDLPAHAWLGWKNFEHEDKPMLTPRQTIEQVHPTPQFISYQ